MDQLDGGALESQSSLACQIVLMSHATTFLSNRKAVECYPLSCLVGLAKAKGKPERLMSLDLRSLGRS